VISNRTADSMVGTTLPMDGGCQEEPAGAGVRSLRPLFWWTRPKIGRRDNLPVLRTGAAKLHPFGVCPDTARMGRGQQELKSKSVRPSEFDNEQHEPYPKGVLNDCEWDVWTRNALADGSRIAVSTDVCQ
jgi:hypothetical protein